MSKSTRQGGTAERETYRTPGEAPDVADKQAESRDTHGGEEGRNGVGGSYDDRDDQGRVISSDDGGDNLDAQPDGHDPR